MSSLLARSAWAVNDAATAPYGAAGIKMRTVESQMVSAERLYSFRERGQG